MVPVPVRMIGRIAADDANVYTVDSAEADLVNRNHWSYKGLKTVTQRMVKITRGGHWIKRESERSG